MCSAIEPPSGFLLSSLHLFTVHSANRWIFSCLTFSFLTLLKNFQWLPTDHNINRNSLGSWHSNSNWTLICLNISTAYILYMKTLPQSNWSAPDLTHIPYLSHRMEHTFFSIHRNIPHSSRVKSEVSLPCNIFFFNTLVRNIAFILFFFPCGAMINFMSSLFEAWLW